jgi:CRISPR/Cas system-associated exonuclease Cas4 (RecB family)
MHAPRSFRVVDAASAAARLDAALAFLSGFPAHQPVTIVGATRGAADDLARRIALARPATLGLSRFSLTQLAARLAAGVLAGRGVAPATSLGAEAVAARVAFDAARDGSLRYFGSVAETPGFSKALARTVGELRLAAVGAGQLADSGPAAADVAWLLQRSEQELEIAATADRARLFDAATNSAAVDSLLRAPLVLLDLAVDTEIEERFVAAIAAAATDVLATCPSSDAPTIAALTRGGGVRESLEERSTDDLSYLRRYLFSNDAPAVRELSGSVEFFSAPGEGRECVEIVRRILRAARRGVPFDEMAVFVRSPHSYFGLLEHALRRAGVPAWFDRGTRRPHPTGRAFLAMLACAGEQLSAARFAEYLSLGQVPRSGEERDGWMASADEELALVDDEDEIAPEHEETVERVASGDRIVAGTLRAPWRWEKLLVEAAVIGKSAARWQRRLDGSANEIERRITHESAREGDDSAAVRGLRQVSEQLAHLKAFALPIVETLAAWPALATWGQWLDHFERLAPRVLRDPAHVLRVLADLRPMSAVGPIDLGEAIRVLRARLQSLEAPPPPRRFGRVLIGTPEQARGRSFRVVFVPGLAERMFPQKPREDPLLLDDVRQAANGDLATQRRRLAAERQLLQLAVGAASDHLYVSYPRIDVSEARARVPSFYGLDVIRAATGTVPDHEVLEEQARMAGSATLAWPAPSTPLDAIDDQEHDLSVLRRLLDEPDVAAVRGHAHYLLKLNENLRRSVIDRWSRADRRWSTADGLTRASRRLQPALEAQRLTMRAYSVTALQRFSVCPYQFVLSAMYRLKPLEQPESMQRMDPLSRGSLIHDIQFKFLTGMRDAQALPVTAAGLPDARIRLDAVVETVARHWHEDLAPAVERVWKDEIAAIRRDLVTWLDHLARDGEEWTPMHFEFAFGSVPGRRDEASVARDVTIGQFKLHGAVDLIECHRQTGLLRVTDHKTGRKPDRLEKVTIGGGAVLQPVLYSMAVEEALGQSVHHGRLFYCSSAGGFYSHGIPLNDITRPSGIEALEVIDRAVEQGFLVAAPAEQACERCDFRSACGPDIAKRVRHKPEDRLADLLALRSRP